MVLRPTQGALLTAMLLLAIESVVLQELETRTKRGRS